MDNVPVDKIHEFEDGLIAYAGNNSQGTLDKIKTSGQLEEADEQSLSEAIEDYKSSLEYLLN